MNNSRKPTFQTNSRKSFQEQRSERDVSPRFNEQKHRENRPHFDKKHSVEKKQPRFQQEVHEPRVAELSLNKSGRAQGNVKVLVKSTGTAYKPKEKKTGALSPRAPEKIKKNRAEEMKVYGENACLALFNNRPESIVRVWATVQMSHKIGEMFSYLAANKKVYHVVDNEELSLVSGTTHHGGICMLVKKQRPFMLQGYLDIPHKEDCLVLLDNVDNAQNIGGVLRTCAFYGVKNVVTNNADNLYSAAAMRVAEGGAEHIRLLECLDIESALQQLRQSGYQVIHVAQDKEGTSLDSVQFNKKVAFLFSESGTLDLYERPDVNVRLSLSSPLKNGLNIAVNSGILLSKWYFSK
ncbi:TrmH family RNA methyltransferase [Rodentibacter genomosp. 2]|uniref:rRNA methyltransferase n=1 Tax=Rodentibacter genomosp. 2 TaxID=1908266 RepID=A0A1V3JP90_9PAST|nr:TrmH family RNA methyltransferase [Rodentibacter genomosp. 2]OOF58113.1 rRNA methyltransferase [Rodentibacter genomosp. 2]OOF58504.1 rRNA methyltransferase [Rodentibacter genomosp. 2]